MSGIVGTNSGRSSGKVGSAALGADSITGAELADDVVDSEHVVAASIDNEHLADSAAGTDEIANNAVTLAKMAGGTDGNIISYDASGDPVAIATGSDGQVLTSAGAGAPPAFEAAAAGGAWTLLDTEVANDSATVTLTGMSSTYGAFAVVISDHKPKDGNGLDVRFGDSGGIDSGSSDYSQANHKHNEATDHALQGTSAGVSQMQITQAAGPSATQGGGGILYIVCNGANNAAGTAVNVMMTGQMVYHQSNNELAVEEVGGMRNAALVITQVQLYEPSASMVAGRFSLYGISHT
jgi:hypothetical protein